MLSRTSNVKEAWNGSILVLLEVLLAVLNICVVKHGRKGLLAAFKCDKVIVPTNVVLTKIHVRERLVASVNVKRARDRIFVFIGRQVNQLIRDVVGVEYAH
jgi:hypothetical protein